MGAPAIFEKPIEIRLLHLASTEGVTNSGLTELLKFFSAINIVQLLVAGSVFQTAHLYQDSQTLIR
jgi:hypothetical protein